MVAVGFAWSATLVPFGSGSPRLALGWLTSRQRVEHLLALLLGAAVAPRLVVVQAQHPQVLDGEDEVRPLTGRYHMVNAELVGAAADLAERGTLA
jgi:hypothetical protein